MWTPRRVMICTLCFVGFFLGYLGYAWTAIGRIDGLPPLPEQYRPEQRVTEKFKASDPEVKKESKLIRKLRLAFGDDCKERFRAIRLEVPAKNMAFAAEQFQLKDGRVVLTPLSVAVFAKDKGDGKPPEIHTIKADEAYLTFDREISNYTEIGSRKLTKAELSGRIEIVSNRGKAERDEDLRMNIPSGRLVFEDESHRVHTDAVVEVYDYKSKPNPHHVIGRGMEMMLLAESPQPAPNQRKPSNRTTITGVKWVILNSGVQMDLYTEGQSTVMGGNAPAANPQANNAAAKPTRTHMNITTPGFFKYEIVRNKAGEVDYDLATFDISPAGKPPAAAKSLAPQHVVVNRRNLATPNLNENLICHQLVLRLKRKEAPKAAPPAGAKSAPGVTVAAKPAAPAAAAAKPAPAPGSAEGFEVETMEATAIRAPGRAAEVVLTSDAERVKAYCGRLFHDARKNVTKLAGSPVTVDKDNDEQKISAAELTVTTIKPTPEQAKAGAKPLNNVVAKGPGTITLVDKKTKKTTRASWETLLTSVRQGNEDVLTLTGAARFVDEAADQSLKADEIIVRLEEVAKRQGTAVKSAGPSGDSRRPKYLEANRNVVARSKEMNIHDSSRLVVWFKDVVGPETLPPVPTGKLPPPPADVRPMPAVGPVPPPAEAGPKSLPVGPATPGLPGVVTAPPKPAGTAPAARPSPENNKGPELVKPPEAAPRQRPFDLTARTVEAWVLRTAGEKPTDAPKSSIDRLWCEGAVRVRQDPPRVEEKGTDVKGDTLTMTAAGGNDYLLVVTADAENLAEMTTDKIHLAGPEINIDQANNKAWVRGNGVMTMESATNFQGDKLDKAVPMTVMWEKTMIFNGESAEFFGNVQATQSSNKAARPEAPASSQKSMMACRHLQVYFDKPISLRQGQGNKTEQPAKVKTLVSDQDVRIEDSTLVPQAKGPDKIVKYTRLECPGVQMVALEHEEAAAKGNPGNSVTAAGPGTMRVWEPGSASDTIALDDPATAAKPRKPADPKKGPEMKLTYVSFGKRMDGSSRPLPGNDKERSQSAVFWENVQVLYMPSPTHDVPIELRKILATGVPEGGLYIRCDRLRVVDRPTDGKPNKQMLAEGNVRLEGREFFAESSTFTYNQQKQQIILHGSEGNPAVLTRLKRIGEAGDVTRAKTIIYYRATGKIDFSDVESTTGSGAPRTKP